MLEQCEPTLLENDIKIDKPLKQAVSKRDSSSAPIKIEDISPLLYNSQNQYDSSVNEYLIKQKTFMAEHKLTRINNAIDAIRDKWPKVTPLEIWIGFDLAGCCSDDLLLKLDEPDFKQQVKTELNRRLSHQPISQPSTEGELDDDEDADDKTDYEFAISCVPQAKKTTTRRRKFSKNNPVVNEPIPPTPVGVTDEEWRSWSDIHRKSFLAGMKDPNTFLYRNCPIGVQRKNGPWSEEEKRAFLKRLNQIRGNKDTIDGKWGIFSLGVPGRVGYQCSNFYRLLIANGEITDSRYIVGSDGKLHHTSHFHPERIGTNAPKKSSKAPAKVFSIKSVTSLKFVNNKNNHNRCGTNDDDESEDGQKSVKMLGRYDRWALQNPLPDAIDNITSEVMKVPTISPDGYVLDYNTWLNVLKTKSENPFTRNHITKRDLIVLTVENIEEYRDKIKNL
ncbi:hypothetical protein M9Y10_045323 [Tritrichomonas musculus]|uniref:Myb-like domain-containing protein n=1 Tax=Tritrichomonas musculus TaxID=1915356 RepID=A0ABR2JW77_9EUKA